MHRTLAIWVAPLAATGFAFAQSYSTTIIHVNTPGHPTNVVPGLGVPFKAGFTTTDGSAAFERPWVSADGLHLGIDTLAAVGGPVTTSNDDIMIVDGVVALREGDVCPWPAGAETVGPIDSDFGINSSGDLITRNNTSAASTVDDYVVTRVGGVWTAVLKQSNLISVLVPGLVGDAGAGAWNNTFDSTCITDAGVTFWRADLVLGLTTGTTNDEILVQGAPTALQEGVSVPTGQAGGATNAWDNFDSDDTYVSGNGVVVLNQGDLLGATTSDDVVVVNGAVVIQEGNILAGSQFVNPVDLDGIVKSWVDSAGNWFVRGNNDTTEDDWVVRNGVVVADSTGTDEIFAGAGEHWSDAAFGDCFFAFDGNANGHYVIGGVTDNGNLLADGVIVFHDGVGNDYVVVREGDPVDLDGNSLFDDDRFYNTFGNDDVRLLPDGSIIFTATLRTGAGTAVDQGVFRLTPNGASCTFRNGTGVNPIACSCVTLPVVGQTWQLLVTPGPQTIATLLFASPTALPATPIFTWGELMMDPSNIFEIPTSLPLARGWHGLDFTVQGLRLDFNGVDLLLVLTNAQDAVLGY